MVGGESIDSNLYPNRIPTGEWMNQAIGYFLIGFCLKCSYQKFKIYVLEFSTKNITVEASVTSSLRVGEKPKNEVGACIVLTSQIRAFTERTLT